MRVQFSLAALLGCMLFAALSSGLMAAAFRPKADEVNQFILIWIASASAGASLGSLLGNALRGAMIGLAILPACFCGLILLLVGLVLCAPALSIQTGWLRWSILAGPLMFVPTCIAANWHPRCAGISLAIAGLTGAGAIILAWTIPWLTMSPLNYDDFGQLLLLSVGLTVFGMVLVFAERNSSVAT